MRPDRIDIGAEIVRRVASGEPCWFPGLTDLLVANFWEAEVNCDPDTYLTATWLGRPIPAALLTVPGQKRMIVEPMPAEFGRRFEAPKPEIWERAPQAISRAIARLVVGGAGEVIKRLVRSVHCVNALGSGYDCSHSDPAIPFSIFVSVPLDERDSELRLAESLLHEAMHLQLTLIERHAAVVGPQAATGYSPWQKELRPVQGLVHGLYVFAAIDRWLAELTSEEELSGDDQAYVARRRAQIRAELMQVEGLPLSEALTPFGKTLASWLLNTKVAFSPAV